MANLGGLPLLTNVSFVSNSGYRAGGLWNRNTNAVLTNVSFWNNAASTGAGMRNDGSDPTLVCVTFGGNQASQVGGAMATYGNGSPIVINTIMWGNQASLDGDQIYNEAGSAPEVAHSLIEDSGGSAAWDTSLGIDVGGNLDADPLFLDAGAGNLRLLAGSPAIDSGDSTGVNLPVTDLEGNPRIAGTAVDMGPYEYQGSTGVGVDDRPKAFGILGIEPNPFHLQTTIRYELRHGTRVDLRIFDVSGRLVSVLRNGVMESRGTHEAAWSGRDKNGHMVSAGAYFFRLVAGEDHESRKVVLVR
jgi:hypothetical protein